jgi:hypothetical protein
MFLAHELWTTLAADGSKGPFYVSTKEAKISALNIFAGYDDAYLSYVPIIKDKNKKNIRPGQRFRCDSPSSVLVYIFFFIAIPRYFVVSH